LRAAGLAAAAAVVVGVGFAEFSGFGLLVMVAFAPPGTGGFTGDAARFASKAAAIVFEFMFIAGCELLTGFNKLELAVMGIPTSCVTAVCIPIAGATAEPIFCECDCAPLVLVVPTTGIADPAGGGGGTAFLIAIGVE
jgi:hypothetical protein